MKKTTLNALLIASTLALGACCYNSEQGRKTVNVACQALLDNKALPETYYSPDGMTLGPDGYIYVSINQVAGKWKHPAKIARISPADKIEDFYVLPLHPKTQKTSPLGLAFAADGNLYVSDNQAFVSEEKGISGIIRVNIKDGKPVGDKRVVTGFNMANGMTVRGNYIYVAETGLTDNRAEKTSTHLSGVYRFSLDELNGDDPLTVTGLGDPHLILTLETKNKDVKVGANGLDFDSKGNLWVGNFGDAELWKYTLDQGGKIVNQTLFVQLEGVKSLDGFHIDAEDNIWAADFAGNALVRIQAQTGERWIVSKNALPAKIEEGEFHSSSESIRRKNKIYISNIDLDAPQHKGGGMQTITVITLNEINSVHKK
ncbi:MAG: SMP-30/gluconolactonase/LRE family protein [Puniceicoccales bacterium]|jgi:sugar lactone lactonase YvrE|nr:SMP-30/gluconolactonase/LRE family protein [Puniceicoccales bacterium]